MARAEDFPNPYHYLPSVPSFTVTATTWPTEVVSTTRSCPV